MSEPDHNLSQDDLERERADMLPDREAMSLIGGDLTQTDAALPLASEEYGAVQQAQGVGAPGADAAADAQQAAATHAAGSSSEGESLTSEDRSETFTASDTASSET